MGRICAPILFFFVHRCLDKRIINFIQKGGVKPMGEHNYDVIFSRVKTLFDKMHQNQKLQELAQANGMDVKNTIKLTDDTINNVAVSVIALSLAKEANDPRYGKLVNTGLQKRSLKSEIINDYKNEANRLIEAYQSGNFQ